MMRLPIARPIVEDLNQNKGNGSSLSAGGLLQTVEEEPTNSRGTPAQL